MQWTNALILEFLHYLEQEPGIWHPRHRNYKDRIEMAKAWSRIQANMSVRVAVVELKRKRDSLMATFRCITSKIKSNAGSGEEVFKTNWFAYESMVRFLGDLYQIKCREDSQDPNDVIKLELPETTDDSNLSLPDDAYDDDTDAAVSVSSKTSNTDVLTPFKPPAYERQPRRRRDVCVCEAQNRDECALYSQLLAKKLRGFDEHTREVLMHEIDNFVFRAKRRKTGSAEAAVENGFEGFGSEQEVSLHEEVKLGD